MKPTRSYTLDVSDLIKSIPPQYLSTATPPPQKVTLQLPETAIDSAHGRLLTTLGEIYRVCPHLFSQPISEANDAKIRIELPNRHNAGPVSPQMGQGHAPVVPSAQATGFPAPGHGSNGAGAGHANGNGVAKTPFEVVTGRNGTKVPAKPIRPAMSSDQGQPRPGHQYERVRPMSPPPAGVRPRVKVDETTDCPPTLLTFELSKILTGVEVRQLGIEVATLPKLGQARLPLSLIKSQLAMGRVVATMAQLLENADEATRQLLVRANPNLEVPIPLKEIFHQLPEDTAEFGPPVPKINPGFDSEIETPFSRQAKQEAERGFPVSLGQGNSRQPYDQSGLAMRAEHDPEPVAAEPVKAMVSSPGDSFDQLQRQAAKQVSQPAATPVASAPRADDDLLDALDGARLFTAPPKAERSKPAPAPVATPATPSSPATPAPGAGGRGLGFHSAVKDLELRAIFGLDESFTPDLVAKLTNELPGILGCVIFQRNRGLLCKSLPVEMQNGAMADQIPGLYEKVVGLSGDLGFHDTETFTLHTGHGVLSFFGEGDSCLSILQQDTNFEPGVRERLVLIARGLAKLLNPEAKP